MNDKAIIELHYFPSIPYMATWAKFGEIIIESKESYTKQSFRNRCRIKTSNKVDDLIVPVRKGNSNIPIQEIRVDHTQSWIKNHLRALQTAYGKSPFFEHYAPDIEKLLTSNPKFLFDLNLKILEYVLSQLQINPNIVFSEKFEKAYPGEIADLRSRIHPKVSPQELTYYHPVEYTQVFDNQFVEDLSILDLLFCEGPNAKNILQRSIGFS